MTRLLALLFILGWMLAIASVFGFLNAFVLRNEGPGIDLGVVAGVLAIAVAAASKKLERRMENARAATESDQARHE